MSKLVPKNQLASRALKTRQQIRDEQQQLWDAGAFNGVLRNGRQVTLAQAVDGLDGDLTNQARENYNKIMADKFTTPIVQTLQLNNGSEFVNNATQNMQKAFDVAESEAQKDAKRKALAAKKTKIPFRDQEMIRAEQQKMWDAGAFEGILRNGKPITYEQAVDGLDGKNTNLARQKYQAMNQTTPRSSQSYQVHPQFGFSLTTPQKTTQEPVATATPKGEAYYISYPNHKISTSGTGLEEVFGENIPLIQGHAGSIIVDDTGNATYHYYGRYGDKGSYHSKVLPKRRSGEDHDAYLKRIRTQLEYANQGEAVTAVHIPNVDATKSREYYKSKPNNGKYNLFNGTTCAGEACAGIDAGLGEDSSSFMDWLVPDTPENVRRNYSSMSGTTTYNF